MDIFLIISIILTSFVLLIQLLILSKHSNKSYADVETLHGKTEDIKNALGRETESIRNALNREVSQLREELSSFLAITRLELDHRFEHMSMQQSSSLSKTRSELNDSFGHMREEQSSSLSKTRTELIHNFERIRESVEKKLQDIQESNSQKLEDMRITVDEKLHKTLEARLGETFNTVSERLEQVHRGLGEMQNLAQGVGDLKKALTNVKIRGAFGEIQLERLLEEVFTPSQYEKNFSVRGREHVEFALKLPNKEGHQPIYLPIDSKFPYESYDRLQNAYDLGHTASIQASQKEIADFIRMSAKVTKEKYIDPPITTDFAIIFLPTEGLYAEVLRIPGLVEDIQIKFHIHITGPTTLLALLNALHVGFKTLAIEKRSGEVWEILSAVKKEFETFRSVLGKTQERIRQAGEEMDKLVGVRTRKILSTLNTIESLPDYKHSDQLLSLTETDDT